MALATICALLVLYPTHEKGDTYGADYLGDNVADKADRTEYAAEKKSEGDTVEV